MKVKSKISYLGERNSILPGQMAEQLAVEVDVKNVTHRQTDRHTHRHSHSHSHTHGSPITALPEALRIITCTTLEQLTGEVAGSEPNGSSCSARTLQVTSTWEVGTLQSISLTAIHTIGIVLHTAPQCSAPGVLGVPTNKPANY